MTLRTKLLLAQAPLAIVLALVCILSVVIISSLGSHSQTILKDNYRSVLAAQRMKESIERMDSAALFLLILAAGRMVLALRRSADARIRGFGLGLLGAGIALLVSNLFDVTFVDPKTSMLAWTLLGVGAALQRIDARGPAPGT